MKSTIASTCILFCLALVPSAHAESILFDLAPFTGGPDVDVSVTLDNSSNAGYITITVDVFGDYLADIRGVYFSVDDDSIFSSEIFSGTDITDIGFNTCAVGPGNNLNGGGSGCISPGGFDVGFSIGSPGIGMDDIGTTTILVDTMGILSLSDFVDFGLRLTSVGIVGSGRDDSSKMYSDTPVPLPAAGWLFVSALLGLGVFGERRRG